MFLKEILIFLFLQYFGSCQSKITCKDENNNNLDWYIIIKYPRSYNFFYLSSESDGKQWQLPNFALNDNRNMLSLTLNQAYNGIKNESFYAFYNDEKVKYFTGTSGGHLKGVVNFNSETGYWMVHSIPKFPTIDNYSYPAPQHVYGQSVICVSLKATNLKLIADQLLMMYTKVYSFNLPPYFSKDPELELKLVHLVNNIHSTPKPFQLFNFTTLNNVPLMHFGKSKSFNEDLYGALMTPYLKTSLYVESWSEGRGENLPSNCTSNYKVYNVNKVKIYGYLFPNKEDHSKWAVGNSKEIPVTCIGDINRQLSQFLRGGGSLCVFHTNIWNAFLPCVNDFEKCT